MKATDRARLYWSLDYAAAGLLCLVCAGLVWTHPINRLHETTMRVFQIAFAWMPLLFGLAFKRWLRHSLGEGALTEDAAAVGSSKIAELLFVVYLGMLLLCV